MAYKDSEELDVIEEYPIGDYHFAVERSSVPGSTNDKIEAICTDKDGKTARKSIQVPSSTQLGGWYVEANETEASVYISKNWLADHIKIVTPPNKTQYVDKETINISGIVVVAYNQDGTPWEGESQSILIGRFAINIADAGGYPGGGGDWDEPGDWDEDWEEGDPTYTLYVEATGALSGRHNDPIVDPSYSYIPAGKDTVKDYGCGGDGGHGGGGGAGASTVVVHRLATNQANSHEVIAIARRHGYGSGGGKGGKGGDGCILIYY